MNNRKGTPARDHTGRNFLSISAMARAWGVKVDTLNRRLDAGWSVEQALTLPADARRSESHGLSVVDPTGRTFPNYKAMARAWGVKYGTLLYRLGAGHTLADALRPRVPRHRRGQLVCAGVDHTGRRYTSITEMCRAWGVGYSAYQNRIARGWSVGRALTTPIQSLPPKTYTDPTGKTYRTIAEAARAWHLDPQLVARRLREGWTLKTALTIKPLRWRGGSRKCREVRA